jgi:histidinol phosphatase-like PHP family hydrolase
MARTNEDVAALLREYAELIAITGGDPFRARTYERAAKEVAGYPADLGERSGAALPKIPGVGTSTAAKITEYLRTGTIKALDELRAKVPPGVLELSKVPGMGPKRALQLTRDLGIASLGELETAVGRGRLRGLSGFGVKSEERILRGITTITRDAALRAALAALPPAASEDQIATALAEHLGITASGAGRAETTVTGAAGSARANSALVRTTDLLGDLHTHTNLTDGIASLEEMTEAAAARGYAYYAITDHAPNLVMQQMTDEKMLAQRERVRQTGRVGAMALLHGTELNIAPDGSVDWDAGFLAGFDVCVASVHSHFDQDRAAMTARFVAAAENPHVNVIGHPLTRKLGRRPPVDVDLPALYAACAATGTALEINASPNRLDLPPEHIAAARAAGVRFSIDTDAHSLTDLTNMRYGVAAARLGGLTPADVINAWPLEDLVAFLRKTRPAS